LPSQERRTCGVATPEALYRAFCFGLHICFDKGDLGSQGTWLTTREAEGCWQNSASDFCSEILAIEIFLYFRAWSIRPPPERNSSNFPWSKWTTRFSKVTGWRFWSLYYGPASLLRQRIAVGSQGALSVFAETCFEDLARGALATPAFLNSEIDPKVCSSHYRHLILSSEEINPQRSRHLVFH